MHATSRFTGLLYLLIGLLVLGMVGCQAQPTSAPTVPPTAPTKAAGQPTIVPAATTAATVPTAVPVATKAATVPTKAAVTGAVDKTKTLTISLDGEADTLDPHVAASRAFTLLDRNVYEPLLGLKRDTFELEPVLAESWTVSSDQLTFTFKLRKGVKFQDGTPFNAEAAKFSLERQLALKKGSYWALGYMKEIKVVDESTLQISINPGGPPFLQALTIVFMVSPKAVRDNEKSGDQAQAWLAANVAGTGPFVVRQWTRGDRMILERFADYWQGWSGKHFERVVLLVIPEAGTQQLMLEQGEVDLAEKFPNEALDAFAKNKNLTIYRAPGVRVLYMRINSAAGLTADLKVRQALAYAFDYAGFRQASGGTFTPSDGPVPAQFMGGWKPEIPYKYDLEKAKSLLAEANVKPGTVFDLYWTAGTPEQQLAAQIMQAGLSKIGYNANIVEQEFAPLSKSLADWGASKDPKTAKHVFYLWTPPRIADAYSYLWYMYHSKASGGLGRNLMYYSNPKVDELIDKGALATTEADKLKYYREATEIIVKESPDVFVGTKDRIYAMSTSVKGFYIHPTWYPAWHLYPLYRE